MNPHGNMDLITAIHPNVIALVIAVAVVLAMALFVAAARKL